MKTRRKLRQRFLPLNMATVVNPLPESCVREGFTRMRETLAAQFAARGKSDEK